MTTLLINLSFCVCVCVFLELDVDKEENSRLGVYWLIKASEQGNVEATNILKQCLETGQGKVSLQTLLF